jgi:hypothetical protein
MAGWPPYRASAKANARALEKRKKFKTNLEFIGKSQIKP